MIRTFRLMLAAVILHAAAPLWAAAETPAPPASPEMTVAAFLERIGELSKAGPGWTLGPEARELIELLTGIGKAYRQNLAERRAADQPVEACLPPQAEIDSDTLFAHLIGHSADQARRTSMAEAFAALVRQKYPCP